MNISPLVSILIPLYNAEKYFSETLESLLKQSYENIEIIIVDDGSTDDSLAIAYKYENLYNNIKVYTQKNSGASDARNKAFEYSSGEYIQYFDADDIMHPNKISSQIEMLQEYGFRDNIVATGIGKTFVNSIENAIYSKLIIHKDYDDQLLFLKESWENLQAIIGPAWLIPRSINEKIGGWNTKLSMNDDGEFFARVAYNANKIIFVEDSIIYYRKGISSSISSDKSQVSIRSQLESYLSYAELVKNDLDKHSLHRAVTTLYSVIYTKYYPLDKQMKEEILGLIKDLGYKKLVIKFKPTSYWIIKILGVDTGLRLRLIKTKLFSLLKRK